MDTSIIEKTIKILKLSDASLFIAKTNKGDLTFKMEKDNPEGFFMLDAVPLDKQDNKELKALFNL